METLSENVCDNVLLGALPQINKTASSEFANTIWRDDYNLSARYIYLVDWQIIM
jgi:hypothetical protein